MARIGYSDYFAKDQEYSRPFRQPRKKFPFALIMVLLLCGMLLYYFIVYRNHTDTDTKQQKTAPLAIAHVDNSVGIFRFSDKKMEQGKNGSSLYQGDAIDTGETNRTILKFDKDDNIRLSADTQIVYTQYNNDIYYLKLSKGKVWFETFEHRYFVETSTGIFNFSSGRVSISADTEGKTTVYCFTGQVNGTSGKNGKEYFRFDPGEVITISKDYEISAAKRFKPELLDSWAKWNLSFSGKNLRDGSNLPKLSFETASDVNYHEIEPSSDTSSSVRQAPTKSAIRFVKDSPTQNELGSGKPNNKDVPKVTAKPQFPKAKPKMTNSAPARVEMPALPEPDYPTNSAVRNQESLLNKPATNLAEMKKQDEELFREAVIRDRRDRMSKGAFYYIDNSKRQKDNPSSVPGYKLNAPPKGPAQFEDGNSNSDYDPPGFLTAPPSSR